MKQSYSVFFGNFDMQRTTWIDDMLSISLFIFARILVSKTTQLYLSFIIYFKLWYVSSLIWFQCVCNFSLHLRCSSYMYLVEWPKTRWRPHPCKWTVGKNIKWLGWKMSKTVFWLAPEPKDKEEGCLAKDRSSSNEQERLQRYRYECRKQMEQST